MGIEDSLCPRHLPIITHTTIHFSQNAVTVAYLLPPSDQITSKFRNSCKERGEGQNLFYQKGVSRLLASFRPQCFTGGDRKQTFLTVLGTEIEFVKTHFMGGKNARAFGNGQMEVNSGIHRVLKLLKCLLFYSSCMTFGLFSLFPLS